MEAVDEVEADEGTLQWPPWMICGSGHLADSDERQRGAELGARAVEML